jgi:hypothetical protein
MLIRADQEKSETEIDRYEQCSDPGIATSSMQPNLLDDLLPFRELVGQSLAVQRVTRSMLVPSHLLTSSLMHGRFFVSSSAYAQRNQRVPPEPR